MPPLLFTAWDLSMSMLAPSTLRNPFFKVHAQILPVSPLLIRFGYGERLFVLGESFPSFRSWLLGIVFNKHNFGEGVLQ